MQLVEQERRNQTDVAVGTRAQRREIRAASIECRLRDLSERQICVPPGATRRTHALLFVFTNVRLETETIAGRVTRVGSHRVDDRENQF